MTPGSEERRGAVLRDDRARVERRVSELIQDEDRDRTGEHQELVGQCLLLNPGELMGMRGVSRLAVVETESRAVENIDLGPGG